ncbi:glycoside hydrolase family 19 protein [Pseudomonas sp. NPDC090208]|uniref:glycoside hydrolase family 19 protein n=1 Tax=Pseudomonas sp. NPDC090208 TaxID=3364478 RepID=UPI0037FB476F
MAGNELVTLAQLRALCCTDKGRQACGQYLAPLNAAMQRYQINTRDRVTMFLAQIAHESADFTRVSENLNYTADGLANTWPNRFGEYTRVGVYLKVELKGGLRIVPNELAMQLAGKPELIANKVYANRFGNGDEDSGDGWRHRGAGLKQLTFKANHDEFARVVGMPLASVPDFLRTPEGAALSAAWFWSSRRLNTLADGGKFAEITQVINGGQNGAKSRVEYLGRALEAFPA